MPIPQEIQDMQDHIIALKNYCMALHKRISLVRENYAIKSEKEKNEVAITTYETEIKINTIKQKISKLQLTFYYQINSYINDLNDEQSNDMFNSTR
jgi:hypothetical protein